MYFSGKHKLYWYKVEVVVLSIGLSIGCTVYHFGPAADLKCFRQNKLFNGEASKRCVRDLDYNDQGL